MRIGDIIKEHRKEQNLTQEQVANYLNVSTPAVNKWEKGISYPDIMLLAPLARILKIDINALLSFNEKLSKEEMNSLTREVSMIASKDGYEEGFKRAEEIIKQYPSCNELILNMIIVLRIYLISTDNVNKDMYEEKIISWLNMVADCSEEISASKAKLELSAIYRAKKEYDRAQELLDDIPEIGIDKRIQQALLYEEEDKIQEAFGIYEKIILQDANEALGAISLIINRLCIQERYDECETYLECGKKLAKACDLGKYNEYQLDLSIALAKKDKEKTIEVIKGLVDKADTIEYFRSSNIYAHMKFNTGNAKSGEYYAQMLKSAYAKSKELDFVKNDPRMKSILEKQ